MRKYVTGDIRGLGVKMSKRTGIFPRDCERLIVALFDEIKQSMKNGEGVAITNFGQFIFDVQHGMETRDFDTGELYHVYPKTNVKFIPCKDLKYGVRTQDWHDHLREDQLEKDWYKRELVLEYGTEHE